MGKGIVLYVSAGVLIQMLGVNDKTIRNGVSKFYNGKSSHWKAFVDKNAVMIDYDTIPVNAKSIAGLPMQALDALALLQSSSKAAEDINADTEIVHFREALQDVYQNRWPSFLKFYEDKITDNQQRIIYAKAHSLIDSIIAACKEKWPSKVIFQIYREIMRSELDSLVEPKFNTESVVYFWRVIRNCKRQGIAETLIHNSRGVSREYKVKMTGPIKANIRLLLRSPKRLPTSRIIDIVKKKYGVELSPSSIKRLKAHQQDRNILEHESNGKILGRQNGLPKIARFLAEGPGEQYQGDFYKLQFYCRGSSGKVVRLWAYVVLDVFSKKVVGWALGEEPSASQAASGFKMAFVNYSFLPEEIVIDNDSLYKRPLFKRLMRRLQNLGVIVTKAFPNIPTWKAEIESFFAVFQKLHSSKPWYIGEGIQSKNIAGNPSREFVKQMYTKVSSMMSISEMTTEFGKMIEEYNYATNERKKKVAPADLFRMYESKRTIKWQNWMEPLLFWKTMTSKRIKNDGRIDLQIDGVEYCYQVTKAEMLWNYKNSDVRMCYDPNDLSKLHLFERGTLKYIGEIEPRMIMTRENKKEVMKKQRRILHEAQQFIKDRKREDEDMVNGSIVGTSKRTESLADKIIKRQMNRRKLEEEVMEVEVIE